MKKFFAVMLVALFGVVPLFADDVADVKAVIVRDCELIAKGDFIGATTWWTPDYWETGMNGAFDCVQLKRFLTSLDGKHPVEYLTSLVVLRSGANPGPDMADGIRRAAYDPEFLKRYPVEARQMADLLKEAASMELKTMKFVSVKVDGDKATVVVTYRMPVSVRETVSLRRIDGEWRIARRVGEAL